MRTRMTFAALGVALAAAVVPALAARGSAPAAAAELPGAGMCNGQKAPNLEVIAHARASGDIPKFILNVSTDANAVATGTLILGQGRDHIVVTDICRVWLHLPENTPKCEEPYPEGATTAHAVGLTARRDGTPLLVRADVRESEEEGTTFRVRYRALTGEHEAAPAAMGEEDGCEGEDESWTWIPAEEEWAPLDQLMVRAAG